MPRNQRPVWHLYWTAALLSIPVASAAVKAPVNRRQCSWSKYGYPFPNSSPTCPPLVHGESDDFAPWSYRPHCIEPVLQELYSSEWCVFTDTTFRGGRGISIVTTPETAAQIVPSLDDTIAYEKDQTQAPTSKKDKYVKVKEIKGKGKGMLAKRDINKWDIVVRDYAMLIVNGDFFHVLDEDEQTELKKVAVDQLPKRARKQFYDLSHTMPKYDLIENILRTNILAIELAGNETHYALFPYYSVSRPFRCNGREEPHTHILP
jgi:hypothetical protein